MGCIYFHYHNLSTFYSLSLILVHFHFYFSLSLGHAQFSSLWRLSTEFIPRVDSVTVQISEPTRSSSLLLHSSPSQLSPHRVSPVGPIGNSVLMVDQLMMRSSRMSAAAESRQRDHRGKAVAVVKREIEEQHHYNPSSDDHHNLNKRFKNDFGTGAFPVPPSQFNPLDEPSPLGLRLKKSPSLLELIQTKLSQGNAPKGGTHNKKENKGTAAAVATDKLKASNFPASLLRIGAWEYTSRYEGDLVAKCYFAKHKLVWEVLDGGLKNKIEIQWSDITALKATYPDDGPGTLDVVIGRQPLFFRETNPQPRKHTLWQATSDFTGGEASLHRRHYLQCPLGLLGKHFEKLIQCDPRLNHLSQQPEIILESPYFEPRISVFNEPNESDEYDLNREAPSSFDLRGGASPSGCQTSSSKSELHDSAVRPADYLFETTSPSSVMDTSVSEVRSSRAEELKGQSRWDQIKVPGLHPSMSMSDLVNHLENRISEQRTSSSSHTLSSEERESLRILDELKQFLFTDSQHASAATDEKCIMSRVNSLCCLLQKDSATAQERPGKSESDSFASTADERIHESNKLTGPVDENEGDKAGGMSRKDSVGELLFNLPKIASLPRFYFNLSDDFDSQAR